MTKAEKARADVIRLPTAAAQTVRQPARASDSKNWPANVTSIRPQGRPKVPIPPSALLTLAVVRANAKKRVRKGGAPPLPAGPMDVHDELSAMMERFRADGDLEVAANTYAAMDLLWAWRTGRW